MVPFIISSTFGPDGVLHLDVPIGAPHANRPVKVSIQVGPVPMTQEEWSDFIERTAGSITDATFCRPEQGELQERDER